MGLFDVKYNFDNLIRTTSAGIEVSSFVQVKNAITERYRQIYGHDIDVSTETGDGQFIMMLSLMQYNGYLAPLYLNQMLDPATSVDKWLDVIAGFSNIFRYNDAKSSVYLYVKYTGTSTSGYNPNTGNLNVQTIECIDKNGKIWKWQEGANTSNNFTTNFYPDTYYILPFTCEEYGPINALADSSVLVEGFKPTNENLTSDNKGDINRTLDPSGYPFEVWQASNAVLGWYKETDEAFRSRRQNELGNGSVTVANGLIGSLLEIGGVEEVKLYENAFNQGITAADGTSVPYHNIYLCVKYQDNVDDSSISKEIGKTINNKLTMGIVTTEYDETQTPKTGVAKKWRIDLYNSENLTYYVYWKKCLPLGPTLTLTFLRNKVSYDANSVTPTEAQKKYESVIKNAIQKHTNGLSLYDDLVIANLIYAINSSDTITNNQNNFIFTSGTVTNIDATEKDIFENKDTYFDYVNAWYEFDYSNTTGSPYITNILKVYGLILTSDETFTSEKTYYQKQNNEEFEVYSGSSGNPKTLGLYEKR